MSRKKLSATLQQLLPGESNKRIRQGILAAAKSGSAAARTVKAQIDQENRIRTGKLTSGTVTFNSTTEAVLDLFAWVIDFENFQPGSTTIAVLAPDTEISRTDYFTGKPDGTIGYYPGSIDAQGNAFPPETPDGEVLLCVVVRNSDGSNAVDEPVTNPAEVYAAASHGHAIADVTGLQAAINSKEAVFDKNTAFNKNFGTDAGTVAQGNDSRINNGQTAFSWRNHTGLYALVSHHHDDRYFSETEINNFFSGSTAIQGYSKSNWDAAFSWGNHADAGYAVLGTGAGQVRTNALLDDRYAAIAHVHTIAEVTGLQSSLEGKLNTSQKGTANGLAGLDSNGKVPLSQINDSIIGQVEYKGTWNPLTNSPTLPTIPAEKGHYYVSSADGTRFGLEFKTGDWIISNGSAWEKLDNTDAVSSVFGKSGAIVAQESDYQPFYVRLSQAYANPTWISSLAYSKITGVPTNFTPSAHTHLISEVSGLQGALDSKETAFSKNTAFNKNFGTDAGTVAQGNDSRINNGQTAFSWGNHANAGYSTQSFSDARYLRYVGAPSDLNAVGAASSIPLGFTSSFLPANRPSSAANYFSGIQFKHNLAEDFRTQLVTNSAGGNPQLHIRTMINGVWGSYSQIWHSGNLPDPFSLTNGNAILGLNKYFGSGSTNTDTWIWQAGNGQLIFNVPTPQNFVFQIGGASKALVTSAGIESKGSISTYHPNSTSQGPKWRLGSTFLGGSGSPTHRLRVQVEDAIYDIPAIFVQNIIN